MLVVVGFGYEFGRTPCLSLLLLYVQQRATCARVIPVTEVLKPQV